MSRNDNNVARSRFETFVLYSLVALVLIATAVMLKPKGPLLEGPLVHWEYLDPVCVESIELADGWTSDNSHTCKGGSIGTLRELHGKLWWSCECPNAYDLECLPRTHTQPGAFR